jgi:hypothetical protein
MKFLLAWIFMLVAVSCAVTPTGAAERTVTLSVPGMI